VTLNHPAGRADAGTMRRLLILLSLSLAALTAGCGGSEPGADVSLPTVRSLGQVAARTESAGSYRFEMTMRMSMPGHPEAFELSAEGAVDRTGRRATMSMDFGSLTELVPGAGLAGDDLTMDMVFDWPVAYMRAPFLSGRLPGAKPWVKLDLAAMAEGQGVGLPSFGSFGQSDPSAFLDFLKGAGSLRVLGQEEVDGVPTTHYLARIDLGAFVDRLPARERRRLGPALAQLRQLTQDGRLAPLVDAWVDGDRLLRRFAMSFSVPVGRESADVSLTMDLHDFGTEVEVAPPPAAEVAELTQLGG
jgi:hypothetical protein